MWFVKKYLIVFLIVMFIIGVVWILIPNKYMDVKWLMNYAKVVKNKISKNQNTMKSNLNNIK